MSWLHELVTTRLHSQTTVLIIPFRGAEISAVDHLSL